MTNPIMQAATNIATMSVARELAVKGDGATMDIGGGRSLKVREEADDMSLMDEAGEGMWCGRLEWEGRPNNYGHTTRPDGMNGRARKIHVGRGNDVVWWQPPADVADEDLGSLERTISDILEHGYQVIRLELREEVADSRGGTHEVKIASAWLGGVEPFADVDYLASIIAEHIWEVLATD